MLNTSLWAYCLRTTLEEKIDYIEIRKSQIMKSEPKYGTCTIRLISLLSGKTLWNLDNTSPRHALICADSEQKCAENYNK